MTSLISLHMENKPLIMACSFQLGKKALEKSASAKWGTSHAWLNKPDKRMRGIVCRSLAVVVIRILVWCIARRRRLCVGGLCMLLAL